MNNIKERIEKDILEKLEKYPPYKVNYREDGRVDIAFLFSDMRETYLLCVLEEIRHKTGVGDKPMLSELADAIVNRYENSPDNRKEGI